MNNHSLDRGRNLGYILEVIGKGNTEIQALVEFLESPTRKKVTAANLTEIVADNRQHMLFGLLNGLGVVADDVFVVASELAQL